jgi:hypothetical protein
MVDDRQLGQFSIGANFPFGTPLTKQFPRLIPRNTAHTSGRKRLCEVQLYLSLVGPHVHIMIISPLIENIR